MSLSFDQRRDLEALDRACARAAATGEAQSPAGRGARRRTSSISRSWPAGPRQLASLDELAELPFTTKDELQPARGASRSPPIARFRSRRYVRCHRDVRHARPAARGARHGRRLAVVDRGLAVRARRGRDDAQRSGAVGVFVRAVHRILERVRRDRGPRGAGDSGRRAGQPGADRADSRTTQATALFCTPTYALRLAEVAAEHNINLAHLSGGEDRRGRRAGRQRAGDSRADRAGLGRAASSIMRARRRSGRGALPTPTAAACTSTNPNSSPSSCRSKRATRPRRASCRT